MAPSYEQLPQLALRSARAKTFLIVLCVGCVLASGCVSNRSLVLGTAPADLGRDAQFRKLDITCDIKIICADQMTGRTTGLLADYGVGATTYNYPLSKMFENAVNQYVYKAFQRPAGDVLKAFQLEVEVFQSRLQTKGSSATYFIKVMARLRSPGEKTVLTEEVEEHAQSSFNGVDVPEAVWQGVHGVAKKTVERIANNPKAHIAAESSRR